MARVEVWKCDHSGKLFEDKKRYIAHLRKLARVNRYERRVQRLNEERDALMITMGNTVKYMDQLVQFIKDNWKWFFYNGLRHEPFNREKTEDWHELVSLSFEHMRWNNNVSNSHVAPKNGVLNWTKKETFPDGTPKPTGYPGWTGQMKISIRGDKYTYRGKEKVTTGFGSRYFTDTPIKTGSGGGGPDVFNYGVTLFADDFPAMAEQREKDLIWDKITA